LKTPLILSGVAPVIVDLITIYDSDPEGIDISILIVDETNMRIQDTQPQGLQPLDMKTYLNRAKGYTTLSDQVSQPQDEDESGREYQEKGQ